MNSEEFRMSVNTSLGGGLTGARGDGAYRASIDGLRAIAVMSVIMFHFSTTLLPGGFAGVDLFFVISGYLITGTLARNGGHDVAEFYLRRIRRIFPALAVLLNVFLLAGWFLLSSQEFRSASKQIVAGAFFASNVLSYLEVGYFDGAAFAKPLLHLWSLGVEEQFYLVWPILVVALRSRSRFLFGGLLAVALLSFAFCVFYTQRGGGSAAFYLPHLRFWELATGGLLSLVRISVPPPVSRLMVVGGLVLFAVVALLLGVSGFPGPTALLPVAAAGLVVLGGEVGGRGLLDWRPIVYVGRISYPLYLWHWPVLSVLRTVAGMESLTTAQQGGALLVTVGLSVATYHWLEMPLRGLRTGAIAVALSCGVALPGAAAFWIYLEDGVPGRTGDVSARSRPTQGCPVELITDGPRQLLYCSSTGGGQRFALLGDSHAEHLWGAAQSRGGPGWLLAGNPSCPPLLGVHVAAGYQDCLEKYEGIVSYLKSGAGSGVRVVVLSMFSGYMQDTDQAAEHVLGGFGPSKTTIDGFRDRQEKQNRFSTGLEAMVSALEVAGKRVVILTDGPELPFLPGRCEGRPWLRGVVAGFHESAGPTECEFSLFSVRQRQLGYLSALAFVVSRHPRVVVVDALDVLCGGGVCSVSRDGRALFRDSHHLSSAGAALVFAKLRDVVVGLPSVR